MRSQIAINADYGHFTEIKTRINKGRRLIISPIDGTTWTTPEQLKDESGKVVTAYLTGVCAMP